MARKIPSGFRPRVEALESRWQPATVLVLRPRASDIVNVSGVGAVVTWNHQDAQGLSPWWDVTNNCRYPFYPISGCDCVLDATATMYTGNAFTLYVGSGVASCQTLDITPNATRELLVGSGGQLRMNAYGSTSVTSDWELKTSGNPVTVNGYLFVDGCRLNWLSGSIRGSGYVYVEGGGEVRLARGASEAGNATRYLEPAFDVGIDRTDYSDSAGMFTIASNYTGTTRLDGACVIYVYGGGQFSVEGNGGSFIQDDPGSNDQHVEVVGGVFNHQGATGVNFTFCPLILSNTSTALYELHTDSRLNVYTKITFSGTTGIWGETASLVIGDSETEAGHCGLVWLYDGAEMSASEDVLCWNAEINLAHAQTWGATATIASNVGGTFRVGRGNIYLGFDGTKGPVAWSLNAVGDVDMNPLEDCGVNVWMAVNGNGTAGATCSKIVNNSGDIFFRENAVIYAEKANMAVGTDYVFLDAAGTILYEYDFPVGAWKAVKDTGGGTDVMATVYDDNGRQKFKAFR